MKKIFNFQFFPRSRIPLRRTIFKQQGGFTLIELLIVVAIIGILSTLLMANFVGIKQRARDGQRKSDLRQVQAALEIFRADAGCYPDASCPTALTYSLYQCGQTMATSGSTYMQKLPCDPFNSGQFIYRYVANGTTYSLITCLENTNDSQKDTLNNATYCDGTSGWSYTLKNP